MKTLLSTLLITLCITAHAQITSTFDTNADGWTLLNTATTLTPIQSASGGNPGGFISATYSSTTAASTQNWIAPAKFLGNQVVRSIDMNIRFDMQQSQAGTASNINGDIRIESNSTILVYSLPTKPVVAPGWSSYSLKLDETQGWRITTTTGSLATRTQIIQVLSSITSIEIRGTFATNTSYTSGIDNVILEQRTLQIAPTITSFSPTTGQPGTSITVNGNNFDPIASNNAVYFGAVAGTITNVSATQLTITIPIGAQYGNITVINKTTGVAKQSDKPFNPTFTDGGRIIPTSFDPAINLPAGSDYGASDAQDFLTVGDMDGDSWPDLISPDVGNTVLIYRNLGAGGNLTAASFSAKFSLTGAGNRTSMKVVDLDGDGKLDIVTAYYVSDPDAGFATYRNISTPGNLAFEPVEKWKGLAYSAIFSSVVDVDGDGRADLIGRGTSGSVDLDFWIAQNISNPGNIEFGGSRSYFGNSINGLNPVTPADLDNDGKPEMIIVSGNIYIAKNNSTPGVISFETPLEIIENGIYGAIHVADFNLDGKNDLAWKAGFNSDDVHIRINTNAGAALAITDFATEVILDSDLFYYGAMSIADVNGDAKPDIIAADNADVGIFENVYSGGAFDSRAFVSAYQLQGISTLTYPTSPLVADLNGDSKPELILYNKNTSPEYISIYENRNVHTPAISFNTVSPLAAPVGATLTITGNYFSTVASENHVRIGGMYATVLTATKTQLTVQVPAGLTYGLVSVTRDQLTSTYRLPFKTTFSPGVSFNNTHFAPPVEFTLTSANYDIDAGDLNRDGKPDILAEGTGSYVFKNIHTTGPITLASLIADDTLSGSFMNPKLEDFDGDGYLDVIAVNGLYRKNNSTSTEISSLPNVSLGIGASNVDFADFNADGKIDMTLTSNGGGQLILLENRTTYDLANFTTGTFASFSQSITIAKPNVGGGVVTADFDNDGLMDVVATNPASDNISIFRNAGALKIDVTQFAARVDVTVSDNPGRIYKGDLDADGKMDLVMYYGTGANASLISVFPNTSAVGTISFSRFDLTMPSASTVAHIDDIDGDGKPEILVTSESGNRFSIFKNLHTTGALTAASFAAPFNTTVTAPRGLFTSDINLNGKPEIIITRAAGLLVVYENLIPSIPPPTITSFTPISGPVGTTVTITGTNFSMTPGNNIVYFGATRANVSAATTTQLTVTVPTGATHQPISVQTNGLTGYSLKPFVVTFAGGGSFDDCSFEPKVNFETNDGLSSEAFFGDIDGDGKVDVITAKRNTNSISIYRNTSISGQINSSSFAPKIDIITGTSGSANPGPVAISFGDIDGDGKPDIAVANYRGGTLAVFRNLSTSGIISLSSRVDFAIGDFGTGASLRDMDGDGKLDAVITSFFDGVSVLRNTATSGIINASSFASRLNFATGPNPFHASIADFDSDGKLDIAVPNANNYTVSLLHNTGTSGTVSFAPQQVVTYAGGTPVIGTGTYPLSAADIDGDGKIDLVVCNNTLSIAPIFRNTSVPGTITFAPQVNLTTSAPPAFASISDLDGDGKIDLAIYNGLNNPILIYKNSNVPGTISTSSFGSPIGFGADPLVGIFGSADIDGDGKNDIVNVAHGFYVLRNVIGEISPPTITSFSPVVGVVGTAVTITGTNFITPFSNTVAFNGTAATIAGSTATTLTVTVPVGATTGPIQVTIGCTSIASSNFTVGAPATITITTQPSNFITCVGQTATFTTAASGTTNITYQWQFSTTLGGTYNDIANGGGYSNVSTASLSVNTTGNFGAGFYRCQVNGDFAPTVFSIPAELTVNIIPSIPTIGTTNLGCAPASTTLNPTGASAGEEYKFYDAATGGTPLTSGLSFTTPSLTVSTSYHISTYNTTTLCESVRVPALVNVQSCNAPVVETSTATAFIEGIVTIDLEPLISDEDDNLDPSTLQIITQPVSGAPASLNGFILTIDYSGLPFPGIDNVEIGICDLTGICTQQEISIELEGDIEVFNAVSPNNDNINDTFTLQYIDLFTDTKKNRVTIFNRWGDVVWEGSDYDNLTVVFDGTNTNGKELPPSTYFYTIDFTSGRKSKTGFLSLKR